MPDPIAFTSASARFSIPFVFAAQSQKELFLNEAHARLDMLLHAAVQGTANAPPAEPGEGECWLVGNAPSGPWADHAGELTAFQAGAWLFAAPRDGMVVLDCPSRQRLVWNEGWQRPQTPPSPDGGSTVDAEARAAIAGLVEALIMAGVLAQE